ncbi:unnamed protein product [Heligmosomoides polygyrus]|uniref:Uncharacterized protein n=1 Tax=Heligmosomoides polygyrus TaxID=6339 RepID=A0A183G9V5_HELPZ|nr:unnamed protein product [Heligmosomoides polygyrus]
MLRSTQGLQQRGSTHGEPEQQGREQRNLNPSNSGRGLNIQDPNHRYVALGRKRWKPIVRQQVEGQIIRFHNPAHKELQPPIGWTQSLICPIQLPETSQQLDEQADTEIWREAIFRNNQKLYNELLSLILGEQQRTSGTQTLQFASAVSAHATRMIRVLEDHHLLHALHHQLLPATDADKQYAIEMLPEALMITATEGYLRSQEMDRMEQGEQAAHIPPPEQQEDSVFVSIRAVNAGKKGHHRTFCLDNPYAIPDIHESGTTYYTRIAEQTFRPYPNPMEDRPQHQQTLKEALARRQAIKPTHRRLAHLRHEVCHLCAGRPRPTRMKALEAPDRGGGRQRQRIMI